MRLQQKLTSKSQGTKPTVGTLKVTVEGEKERERERSRCFGAFTATCSVAGCNPDCLALNVWKNERKGQNNHRTAIGRKLPDPDLWKKESEWKRRKNANMKDKVETITARPLVENERIYVRKNLNGRKNGMKVAIHNLPHFRIGSKHVAGSISEGVMCLTLMLCRCLSRFGPKRGS